MARDAPCTYSTKLKIINLPKHYPVVKVPPLGEVRAPGSSILQRSAGRWVGMPTDQGSDDSVSRLSATRVPTVP